MTESDVDLAIEWLQATGWRPPSERDVAVWVDAMTRDGWLPASPQAVHALRQWGGAKVATDDLSHDVPVEPLDIDPRLARGEQGRFADFSQVIGRDLYPLGEGGGGLYFIAITEDGRVFAVGDQLVEIAHDIDSAMVELLLGKRARKDRRATSDAASTSSHRDHEGQPQPQPDV